MARKPRTSAKNGEVVRIHPLTDMVRGRESLCFVEDADGIPCYEVAELVCEMCSYSACKAHAVAGDHMPIAAQIQKVTTGVCAVRDLNVREQISNANAGRLCRHDTTQGVDCYNPITHTCDRCNFSGCQICTTLWHGVSGRGSGRVIGYDRRKPEQGRYSLTSSRAEKVMKEKIQETQEARDKMYSDTDDLLARAKAGQL